VRFTGRRGDALAKLFAVALDGSNALHDAHHRCAPRAAPGANRGMPLLLAGYDFMFGDQDRALPPLPPQAPNAADEAEIILKKFRRSMGSALLRGQ
jgi:hypothetical protein